MIEHDCDLEDDGLELDSLDSFGVTYLDEFLEEVVIPLDEFLADNLAEVREFVRANSPAEAPAAPPAPAPISEPAPPTVGQRFVREFGRMGGVWYVEGKTFAEAEALYAVLMPKPLSNLERFAAGIRMPR